MIQNRRRGDYVRPLVTAAVTAVITALATILTQWAADAAKEEYWKRYTHGVASLLAERPAIEHERRQ